jgi:hypothetical protein
LFVEEVARRKWPYLLILPFAQIRFQQDFSPADWHRILPFIEQATHVEEISGEESAQGAYMESGVLTVEKADIMIAVWDGKTAAGFGGTADVVAYTRDLGKPLLILNPATGDLSEERLEQRSPKPATANRSEHPRALVEAHFQELDEAAKKHGPGSRNIALRIILLQLFASAIGFFVQAFDGLIHFDQPAHHVFLTVELILLGWALGESFFNRKRRELWAKTRIEAEICRSVVATWDMRRRADHIPNISILGFAPLCRNLRLIRLLDKAPCPSLASVRDGYLNGRLENQRKYFVEQSANAQKVHRRLKRLAVCCTVLAIVMSFLAFLLSQIHLAAWFSTLSTCVKFVSLLLPLGSATFFSWMVTQDYSRRAVRYDEMATMLTDATRRLRQVQTWNGLGRVTAEAEEELLQEIVEWHSFRQFASELH